MGRFDSAKGALLFKKGAKQSLRGLGVVEQSMGRWALWQAPSKPQGIKQSWDLPHGFAFPVGKKRLPKEGLCSSTSDGRMRCFPSFWVRKSITLPQEASSQIRVSHLSRCHWPEEATAEWPGLDIIHLPGGSKLYVGSSLHGATELANDAQRKLCCTQT